MALPALGAIVGGLGKGLLGLGKGLSKGMSGGNVLKTAGSIVGNKNKISAPRQENTSQTISPSYYEEPKKQSVFKRTASDGSIESVKITVTNIKSVLFKKQKQLAKRRKHNADLERRFSDLENKRSAGGKIGKGFGKVLSPFSGIMSGIASAIPLMIASILANTLLSDGVVSEEEKKEKLTKKLIGDKEKPKPKGWKRWLGGAADWLLQDATDFDNRGVSGGESAADIINSDSTSTKDTSKTSKPRFFGIFGGKKNEEKLKKLNDTSIIDNDNEVTNTLIINRPIEVPAK